MIITTLEEIKLHVDVGFIVNAINADHVIKKDLSGEYLITCLSNRYVENLINVMTGKVKDFRYYIEDFSEQLENLNFVDGYDYVCETGYYDFYTMIRIKFNLDWCHLHPEKVIMYIKGLGLGYQVGRGFCETTKKPFYNIRKIEK